jgi:hypothetical protein
MITGNYTVTTEQATQVFEAWETDFRSNKADFYTADEVARMAVAELSEQRAIHFMALLREVAA